MGNVTLVAVLCLVAMTAAHRVPVRQAQKVQSAADARSVWDGVYTEEQAKRGGALYYSACSSCHGEKMNGNEDDDTPALVGKDFQKSWNGRSVGALFDKISRTMPRDNPAHMQPGQYADIVAFILNANQFPAAKAELAPDIDILRQIRIEAARTASAK